MDKSISQTMNACRYIQGKTGLSRSIIMKHPSQLTKKKAIVIRRGVLIEIIQIPPRTEEEG